MDTENDIYVREGYGAVVGACPDNCENISDVVKFTMYDFNRKKVGESSLVDKILGRDKYTKPYYGYGKLLEEGYDLLVGPGGAINGQVANKLVYCKNYLDILNAENKSNKTR